MDFATTSRVIVCVRVDNAAYVFAGGVVLDADLFQAGLVIRKCAQNFVPFLFRHFHFPLWY